jgi:hypothetical protein
MTLHGRWLFVAVAVAGAVTACGGSSSETPPPLQPDPKGFLYAGASASARDTSDAGPAPALLDPSDDAAPRAPARSTWGTPPARH